MVVESPRFWTQTPVMQVQFHDLVEATKYTDNLCFSCEKKTWPFCRVLVIHFGQVPRVEVREAWLALQFCDVGLFFLWDRDGILEVRYHGIICGCENWEITLNAEHV